MRLGTEVKAREGGGRRKGGGKGGGEEEKGRRREQSTGKVSAEIMELCLL